MKHNDCRRRLLAPNVVVSLAVKESINVQEKSKAEENVAMHFAYDRRTCTKCSRTMGPTSTM